MNHRNVSRPRALIAGDRRSGRILPGQASRRERIQGPRLPEKERECDHESPRRPEYFVTQRRDRGFAGDFVRGIWMMLQQESPEDYILATGETHSIRDFLDLAFSHVGLRWEDWMETDPALVRPVDVGQEAAPDSKPFDS